MSSKNAPKASSTSKTGSAPSGRRPIVPNIAAAGRLLAPNWADKKPTSSNIAIKEERGSGKYANGAARGRGRPSATSKIVKSEGVFSQGIGEDVKRQRGRPKRIKGEETVVGKLETPLHDPSQMDEDEKKQLGVDKKPLDKKPRLGGPTSVYEEIWQSDEELDEDELGEILGGGGTFISDLKKCDQLPLVLPINEEEQFNRLVRKGAAKEDEEMVDIKDIKLNLRPALEPTEPVADDKQSRFLRAAHTIRCIANESEDHQSPLMLFQLPSSIFRAAQSIGGRQKAGDAAAPPAGPSDSAAAQNDSGKKGGGGGQRAQQNQQQQHKNCLDSFPAGAQIGKIQFLRSGRAVLKIGANRMDISTAIESSCFETLLRIENAVGATHPSGASAAGVGPLFSSPASQLASSRSSSTFLPNGGPTGHPLMTSSHSPGRLVDLPFSSSHGRNSAHLLGPLPHQFVCSFDFNRLLGSRNQPAEVEEHEEERRKRIAAGRKDNNNDVERRR